MVAEEGRFEVAEEVRFNLAVEAVPFSHLMPICDFYPFKLSLTCRRNRLAFW